MLQASQLSNQASMTTFVDHAYEQKQRTRRNTMVDHLHHATRDGLIGECKRAKHDKAQVRHA